MLLVAVTVAFGVVQLFLAAPILGSGLTGLAVGDSRHADEWQGAGSEIAATIAMIGLVAVTRSCPTGPT